MSTLVRGRKTTVWRTVLSAAHQAPAYTPPPIVDGPIKTPARERRRASVQFRKHKPQTEQVRAWLVRLQHN